MENKLTVGVMLPLFKCAVSQRERMKISWCSDNPKLLSPIPLAQDSTQAAYLSGQRINHYTTGVSIFH